MGTRAHVHISGRVQGVTFRASTRRKARDLEVKGWVKNLPDGRVEAVFEGSQKAVKEIIDWCHHGPRPARVDNVEVGWEEPKNEFESFKVKF